MKAKHMTYVGLRSKLYIKWRRHPDLNRGIAVLQTAALPLGYVAPNNSILFYYKKTLEQDCPATFLVVLFYVRYGLLSSAIWVTAQ